VSTRSARGGNQLDIDPRYNIGIGLEERAVEYLQSWIRSPDVDVEEIFLRADRTKYQLESPVQT